MPVEYDAKRDKFYLTLYDSCVEYAVYPDYMEDLYKEMGEVIAQRKELINKKV